MDVRIFGFWDVVGILYKHVRFYRFHQIPFLCDHHELACTAKDPPRRVDMNESSLIFFIRKFIESSTEPFENPLFWNLLTTAYVFLYFNIFGILLLSIISVAIECYWALFEPYWALFRPFRQNLVLQKGPHGIRIALVQKYVFRNNVLRMLERCNGPCKSNE